MNKVISRYVFLFDDGHENYLAYISRSNSFCQMSKILYESLLRFRDYGDENILETIDKPLLDSLEKRKILVSENEDDDYVLKLELETNIKTYSQNILSLVIAPTTNCNFACPYCFEEHKQARKMSDQTIDNLLTFITSHKNAKKINIVWYGGEPLLGFDVIRKILPRIKNEIPQLLNTHRIITNGYYFDEEKVAFFKKYPLKTIQITLDGKQDRHDRIRCLKGSLKGSYNQIIQNIDLILRELPETHVSLRINLDNSNQQDFIDVYKELKNKWQGYNLSIYPGILRLDNEDRSCLSCEAMSSSDLRNFHYELNKCNDTKIYFYPLLLSKSCSATGLNSYVIGPEGEIYKCWNDVSDPAKIIGYIDQTEFTNSYLYARYVVGCNCFHDTKCVNCFFLPICMGGCAWYKLRNLYEYGSYDLCTLYKNEDALRKCLLLHYDSLNQRKEV